MKVEFCSLSSGSSGNCYYLGNEFHGILIDAGISARSIKNHLKSLSVPIHKIMGILITHNHSDHIRSLHTLTNKFHLPVFSSKTVWKSILESKTHREISNDCIKYIEPLKKYQLAGFDFEAFPVSHDTPETLGYHIVAGSRKITIVTDLGHICENASKYIKMADFLVIESNYDREMLLKGSYPFYLKNRIIGPNGHLDNVQTASFLAEHFHSDLSHICLAHLSKNNNTPLKALETLEKIFTEKGKKLNEKTKVLVLKRDEPSDVIQL